MKFLVLLVVVILSFSIMGFLPTVDAQTCSGTPNCGNFKKENPCNNHCACSWDGASCISLGCSSCGDQTSCEASACTWTPAPETPAPETPEDGGGGGLSVMEIGPIYPLANSTFRNGENIEVEVQLLDGSAMLEGEKVVAVFGNSSVSLVYNSTTKTHKGNLFIQNLVEGEYIINISAERSDYYDAESSATFSVDPRLVVSLDLEEGYVIGSEIPIKGSVKDFSGDVVSTSLSVSATVDRIKMFDEEAMTEGVFEHIYRSTFFDVEGVWVVRVEASDPYGNSGVGIATTAVRSVLPQDFYTVSFRSPPEFTLFKRGDDVKIEIIAEQRGNPVDGVDFVFRAPNGEKIQLDNLGPGIYGANHKISFDTPDGRLNLYVIGNKVVDGQTNTGMARNTINVEQSGLLLEILLPSIDELVVGRTISIVVKARYPDGTVPETLDIHTTSPSGERISMVKKLDNYVGEYKISNADVGVWKMDFVAEDNFGNSGSITNNFPVLYTTPYYFVLDNWPVFAMIFVAIVVFGGQYAYSMYSKHMIEGLREEAKKLKEMKKQAQMKYYNKGSINKQTYQELMKKYETQEAEVRKKMSSVKAKKNVAKVKKTRGTK